MMRGLLRLLTRLLYRVELRNPHGTQFTAQRLLIVANHESFIDGLLLSLYLPVNPVFVVNTRIARIPVVRLILRLVDHLTVEPNCPMSVKTIVKLVESGRPVVIFPEGRITTTSGLMKIYDGPAFVATKTDATLVPIRLDGPARARFFSCMGGDAPRYWFPKIRITIQASTKISTSPNEHGKARHHHAGEALRLIMQDMMFATVSQTTLFDAVLDASRNFGPKRRMIEDVREVEYRYVDLIKMALMLGRMTSRLGEPGERIGILLPNLVPSFGVLLGLGIFRRVPAMLNYTAGTEGMQNACIAAQVKTIITSRAFLEQSKLGDKVLALRDVNIVYLEDLRKRITPSDKLWWLFFARWCPKAAAAHGAQPDDPAVVLFTSGSEGRPKGVVLSHRALVANTSQVRAIVDFNTSDKVLNVLPIFHSFGLTAGLLLPLMTGTRVFLYPTPRHYRIIPEISYDRGCTILFGSSTFLAQYGKAAHPFDFHRLRYVIAGAEKLSPQVRELWFEKFGIRIYEGYGVTETAPALSFNSPMASRTGTVGQLVPGLEAKLVPVEGIPRGGVLHIRGPNVMSGYLRFENPGVLEPTHSELGPGWHDTGDVAEFDADGFMRIQGRVKRFAKIAGEMISLDLVERIANAASPDTLNAASAQPDAARGEALVLFTTNASLTREQLQGAARQLGLSELSVPRKIVVLEALPVLGTGKTDYMALLHMAKLV